MYSILDSYPDFMENSKRANYRSKHIMGELWREAILLETESLYQRTVAINEVQEFLSEDCLNILDRDYIVQGSEQYMENAMLDYRYYCKKLRMISARFGVKNEAEAITGYVSHLSAV